VLQVDLGVTREVVTFLQKSQVARMSWRKPGYRILPMDGVHCSNIFDLEPDGI
jgi:hypothetical protein